MDNLFNTQTLMSFFGIVAAIIALGVLIAVHEAGHLLMGKMCNIRVDIFSIGMGKAIWSKKFGETSYQIGWIPFGGYCAFGEEDESNKADPRSILNAPYWAKALTIIGGSLFNMIFAFLMFLLVFGVGYNEFRLSNVVQVDPFMALGTNKQSSPAWEAGLRSGDTVIAISDVPVRHFTDITVALATENKAQPTVTYIREKATNTLPFTPLQNPDTGMVMLGVSPVSPAEITEVLDSSPAALAGFRVDDVITAINDTPILYAYEVEKMLSNGVKNAELKIQIKRGADNLTLSAILQTNGEAQNLGVVFAPPLTEKVPVKAQNFGQNILLSFNETKKMSGQMLASLQKLFSGKINVRKNLSGPVRIVSITSEVAQTLNIMYFIRFALMLSIALAVFNMLPIPGLDGGALVLNGVRALTQKTPFAQQAETAVSFIERAGLIILLLIAAFVFYNDIANIRSERKAQTQQVQTP